MTDLNLVLFIIFVVGMAIFLIVNRKKLTTQKLIPRVFSKKYHTKAQIHKHGWSPINLIMYETKWGIKSIDWIANKFGRLIRRLSWPIISLSIIGMIFLMGTFGYAIYNKLPTIEITPGENGTTIPTITIIKSNDTTQAVALVLPVKTKSQMYVPFMYWIMSLIVLIIIHEGSHGIFARANGIRIKSTGFAFMTLFYIPIIPAAFVNPDEKTMKNKSTKAKLSIIGAGPISNVITGFILLLALTFATPIMGHMFTSDGLTLTPMSGSVAEKIGIQSGEILYQIDGQNVTDGVILKEAFMNKTTINTLTTNVRTYTNITLQDHKIGFYGEQHLISKLSPIKAIPIQTGYTLLYWLFVFNLGVGLMNLLPASIVDGGQFVRYGCERFMKKKTATRVFTMTTIISLVLIITLFII